MRKIYITKKLVSFVLTLGIIASLFTAAAPVIALDAQTAPVTADITSLPAANAAAHEAHCYCGGTASGKEGHTCTENVVWQAVAENATALPTAGNWYLTGDLNLVSGPTFYLTDDLHLCFNGYTVTIASNNGTVFGIHSSVTKALYITFCDCKTGGGITHQHCNIEQSGVIYTSLNESNKTSNYSHLTEVFGGIFDTRNSFCSSGGIFCARGTETISIYGGTFLRNAVTSVTGVKNTVPNCAYGGAICAVGSSFINIYGGNFDGCTAINSSGTGFGGVVCARASSTVTIAGGRFTNCSAMTNGNIAAINLITAGSPAKLILRGEIWVDAATVENGKQFYAVSGSSITDEGIVVKVIGAGEPGEHENHCYCAGSAENMADHTCTENVEWSPLPASTTVLPTAGNWYLTGNISLPNTAPTAITGDLHICFNSYKITVTAPSSYLFMFSSANTAAVNVSFCDCRAITGGITHGKSNLNISGVILTTATENESNSPYANVIDVFGGIFDTCGSYCASGGIFCVKGDGILNIYGGVFRRDNVTNVTGVSAKAPNNLLGGAICAVDTSKVAIYGGTFDGCISTSTDKKSGLGGVVCVRNSAEVTIAGGKYLNCSAILGGGIAATQNTGVIRITGKITTAGCTAKNGGLFHVADGGRLYVEEGADISGGAASETGGCIYNNGTLIINGGRIAGGAAAKGGCIYTAKSLTLKGGVIENGVAAEGLAFNNQNGGGNLYLASAEITVTMNGGRIADGVAYGAGGNIFVPAKATFIQYSGTVTGGKVNSPSSGTGVPFDGGNVYIGGTYIMDKAETLAEPVVEEGVSLVNGGGNFSLNVSTSKLLIKAGTVKNGACRKYSNRGNIWMWYAAGADSVEITGGTVTSDHVYFTEDIIDSVFNGTGNYRYGGISANISGNYQHVFKISGNAQILDTVALPKKAEGAEGNALVKLTGFTGTVQRIALVNDSGNTVLLDKDETYVIGTGWDKDYFESENAFIKMNFGYTFENGTVTLNSNNEYFTVLRECDEAKLCDIEKLEAAVEEYNALSENVKSRNPEIGNFISNISNLIQKYNDMLGVRVAVTDNYGKNKDQVLLTFYSCMDEEGIDASAEKKDWGYDFARIIVNVDGKTYDVPTDTAYKTVTFNGSSIVNADKITAYDYVYLFELPLDKALFDGETTLTAKACITTVGGKEIYGEEKQMTLKNLYPVNTYEDTAEVKEGHTATNAEARTIESFYEGLNVYHGEMHDHSDSGGTSDGHFALENWGEYIESIGLDFAAILDHRQVLHMYSEYWQDNFIGASEAGTPSVDGNKLHYNMVFADPEAFLSVIRAFPEFKYDGGEGHDGHFVYCSFTRERFEELFRAIRAAGGYAVIPHPMSTGDHIMKDNNIDNFWYGDYFGLEVLYWSGINDTQTARNYELWKQLLAKGRRLYACAGGDGHTIPDTDAMTTLYAKDNKAQYLVDVARTGNTTAGGASVRMAIGDTVTGGHKVFTEGERLIVAVGDFHETLITPGYKFRVKIYCDETEIADERVDAGTMNYYSVPVDTAAHYYRAVVYRTDENSTIVAYGNPIWNDIDR